jgi:4-hydroxy-2-oxoheptanedioate aldolase
VALTPAPNGRTSVGAWLSLTDPAAASLLAGAGFDWLCVDEQHGGPTPADTARIAAAVAGDVRLFVRVAWNRPEYINRALDSGATGVIVPMVQSAEDAAAAAAACRYPPVGGRSWGPTARTFATQGPDAASANAAVACLVMVETPDALAHVDAIAAVPGVDGIFVGPFDLSLSLGLNVDEMLADDSDASPLARVVAACREHGIVAGAYAGSAVRARPLRDRGFELIAVTTDAELLSSAGRDTVSAARESLR